MTATQTRVRELLSQLIESETGLNHHNDPENFKIAHDYALNKFKTHRYVRTNQFDVISRLEGLEEKFRVYNRDDLADALHSRLEELPSTTAKLTPEILHLFLELSDQPLHKSHVEDLEKLIRPSEKRELTWEDVIGDEPLEGDIWEDVDFGAESSDAWSEDEDEGAEGAGRLWLDEEPRKAKRQRKRKDSLLADDEEAYRVAGIDGFVVESDKTGLDLLVSTQYWNQKVPATDEEIDVSLGSNRATEDLWILSEVQALREVIFMLLGHSCVILDEELNVAYGLENMNRRFALRHTSLGGYEAVLGWFATQGKSLNRIRAFSRTNDPLPEKQAFIAAVHEKMAELDKALATVEARFVGPGASQPVSLLSLQTKLDPFLRPFNTLSSIIHTAISSPSSRPSHLELLFESASRLQSIDDRFSFEFIASIFFKCLQTYLRPIQAWMENGVLLSDNFFVTKAESHQDMERGTLWHSQYHLRRDPSGNLTAPRFVHHAVNRIFITGKSVVFLKSLLQASQSSEFDNNLLSLTHEEEINFNDVLSGGSNSLAPFSDLFAATFNRWIAARHHSISSRLRNVLFRDCGLWKSLNAIETIYLAKNGFLFESLAQAIFEKVDRGTQTWNDRFLLTELAQGIFSGIPGVQAQRLRMRVIGEGAKKTGKAYIKEARSTIAFLEGIEIDYKLPWPVLNILIPSSFTTYKRIFTLLLQLRRSKYLVERLNLLKSDDRSTASGMLYFAVKQRLLWFLNIIFTYLTDLVLRPQTEAMRTAMEKAVDVDGMVTVHNRYVEKIREMCLLGQKKKLMPIRTSILQILNLCVKFSDTHLSHSTGSSSGTSHPILNLSPNRRHHRRRGSSISSDSFATPSAASETQHGSGDEADEDSEEVYERRMTEIKDELVGLVRFVKEGLKGVARAGVMPHLDLLAEELAVTGGEERDG